jgi:hypothetical protein
VIEHGHPAHQLRVGRRRSRRPCGGTIGCPGPPSSQPPRRCQHDSQLRSPRLGHTARSPDLRARRRQDRQDPYAPERRFPHVPLGSWFVIEIAPGAPNAHAEVRHRPTNNAAAHNDAPHGLPASSNMLRTGVRIARAGRPQLQVDCGADPTNEPDLGYWGPNNVLGLGSLGEGLLRPEQTRESAVEEGY